MVIGGRNVYKIASVFWVFIFLTAATAPVLHAAEGHGKKVRITLLHFNDIYEITPVSGGKEGGPARVAALRKDLLKKNPNTLTFLGGDLFSPSAMGTIKVDGERLAGKQMVDVLNRLGLDYATFGNHEFDLKKDPFYKRIGESKFTWISSNVYDEKGRISPDIRGKPQ